MSEYNIGYSKLSKKNLTKNGYQLLLMNSGVWNSLALPAYWSIFLIVRKYTETNDAFPVNFTLLMAQATHKSQFRKQETSASVVKLQRIVTKLHNASHLDDYLLRRSKLIINYLPAFYPSHFAVASINN